MSSPNIRPFSALTKQMATMVMIGTAMQTKETSRQAMNNPIRVTMNMPEVAATPAIIVRGPRIDGSLSDGNGRVTLDIL